MSTELTALSAQINEAHEQALQHASNAVECARRAGEFLNRAKAEIAHGDWLPWIEGHCPEITPRTAQRYMRIAKEWPKLEAAAGANATHVSQMTIRDAVDHLTSTTTRLSKLDSQSLSRVHEISTEKPVVGAIAQVNNQNKRETYAQAEKERTARRIENGEVGVYDQWADIFDLLTSRAETIQGKHRPHMNKIYMKRLDIGIVPYVPDAINLVPDAVLQEMHSRRDQMRVELKKRIKELLKWGSEQGRHIAEPLWEFAGGLESREILIGRRYAYKNSEFRILDMTNMAVPFVETPHKAEGCDCQDIEPLGVARIKKGQAA